MKVYIIYDDIEGDRIFLNRETAVKAKLAKLIDQNNKNKNKYTHQQLIALANSIVTEETVNCD